jgi:carboxyl-terminal processing protease
MLPASVKGPGMNMGFPDVCLTPSVPSPVPIPYPNMAMHAMASPFCATILNSMMPALNMGSIIPMTTGDEPGVAHPFFKQMGMFTMGSPKVILQGLPAITLTCQTVGNNMNNAAGVVTVPGAPTILYGDAGRPAPEKAVCEGDLVLARGALIARDVRPSLPRETPGGAGLVVIRVLAWDVPAAFRTAVARLSERGCDRLILDLTGNPGGEVSAAIELLRDLLPEGAVIATLVDRDGDAITYRARGDACRLPITVRVDRGTASAAELLAGSLQAHGRAALHGERTHGKSAARACLGGAAADVARFLLPDGRDIQGAGLTPDLPLEAKEP